MYKKKGKPRGNPKKLVPFKKGYDPRRNLKGRPKSFDQLRELAQILANSKADDDSNVTIVQDILYQMATDKKLMKDFLEYAYGKVPLSQIIDVTSGGKPIGWKDFINGNSSDTNAKPSSK